MTDFTYQILDLTDFPVVTLRSDRLQPGKISNMIDEFEHLLCSQRPFALQLLGGRENSGGTHDDQKAWVLWLKENRSRMAAACKGVVSMKSASIDASLQEKQAAGMQAMLGLPVIVADDLEHAQKISNDLFK